MFLQKIRTWCSYSTLSSSSCYVTTPIFYVNAAPHIGHLYSAVIADAITRYECLRQYLRVEALLCTGTDEHGTKIQQAAAANGVPVAQYCNEISQRYRLVFKEAHIAHTDFIRTTEQRHKQAVTQFWRTLHSRGHIYSDQYSGWYCVSDETFLTESQLGLNTDTGVRYSLESGHPVEWTEETNYMFRLSALQEEVLRWAQKEERIRPIKFGKILLDMLSEPLPDVSISRPANRVHWAIPVPDDETQTVYVWLDALVNYLTSAGYPDKKYILHWPPKVQVIGKDILKFHGIYWPAFLIAADLEPPQELFVHSHWTVDGQKMSKSKHNVVDPLEAASVYTMEGLRYFLLREGVAHNDGNYSSIKALRILNSELADTLGNLLSRACAKSLNPRQIYPRLHATHLQDILRMDAAKRLQEALQLLGARCAQHYDDRNFYLVVDTVMATLHAANNFFETARPWELKSVSNNNNNNNNNNKKNANETIDATQTQTVNIENVQRLETIIGMTMDTLRCCGIVLQPIVPQLSGKLLDKLNVPQEQRLWRHLSDNFANATATNTAVADSNVEANATKWAHTLQAAHPLGSTDAVLFRRILLKENALDGKQNAVDKKVEPSASKAKTKTKAAVAATTTTKTKSEKVAQ